MPVCELDGTGAVTAVDTFGADGLASRRVGSASAFYTFDPQGNTAQRLNAAGAVVSSDLYNAFGAATSTASSPDVFGFSGQWGGYTDAETGLVLMTHRYYDPATGRFLTRDPMGCDGGLNLCINRSPYATGFPSRHALRVWLPKRAKPSASAGEGQAARRRGRGHAGQKIFSEAVDKISNPRYNTNRGLIQNDWRNAPCPRLPRSRRHRPPPL